MDLSFYDDFKETRQDMPYTGFGEGKQKTAGGYHWKYVDEEE